MTESDFRAFEAVGALVVVLDVEGRIVYWNQACSDLTGYSLEEVRGRLFWDFLLVPEEVEPVKAVFAKLRAAEPPPSRFANYWVTKTGDRRWIAWLNKSTRSPDEQVQYIIATGIDRTERKVAEAKLGGIIDTAPDAIISIDGEHRIVIYNKGAEKIFGWSAAEVMGKPVEMLLPERFRAGHAEHVRDFASGEVTARRMGKPTPAIFGLRKNGAEFPARVSISRLDVDGGRLFTAVLRDVTEQRRREREVEFLAEVGAVLESTLDYDGTVTSIARLVVRDLADCCIVDLIDRDDANSLRMVLHRDPAKTTLCEILERFPIGRKHPSLVSSVLESKQASLMAEVSSRYLESIARDDEHLRALRALAPRSCIVVPLLARGELLGTLTLVASQPSRRYGQEDLHLAEELAYRAALAIDNARLYANARRATGDALEANQQLVMATIRAQELTEQADEAKARAEESEHELRRTAEFREMFIGILGHDLRSPLGAINMAAGLLQLHGNLEEKHEKTIARIIRSSERMTKMINQLLDLTRARLGGGFPLEPKPTDLREVCENVIEEFEAAIDLEVAGDLTGSWDSDRLAEAISNITRNAIEHAAPGTAVVVRIVAAPTDVVLEISNQGDPIPADILPFIFEPFRRAKQREKSPTGNLGLGLYIAKQIVVSHRGTLEVRSSGGTTTFAMRLPRPRPHDTQHPIL